MKKARGQLTNRFKGIEYLHRDRGEIPFIPRCYCQFVNSCGRGEH